MLFGPIKLLLKIIALFLSSVLLYFAFGFVQIWLAGHQHSHRVSDAIVVFGTRQDNCVPSPTLAGRLDEVVRLYELHLAPRALALGRCAHPLERHSRGDRRYRLSRLALRA